MDKFFSMCFFVLAFGMLESCIVYSTADRTFDKVAALLSILTLIGSLVYLWCNATAKFRADLDHDGALSVNEVEAWHHDQDLRMSGCEVYEQDMQVTTTRIHEL